MGPRSLLWNGRWGVALDFQDNVDPPCPKITGVPERIYLEIGEDADGDFDDFREVTWCRDKQFNTDIEYVLASKLASAESRLAIAAEALERIAEPGRLDAQETYEVAHDTLAKVRSKS